MKHLRTLVALAFIGGTMIAQATRISPLALHLRSQKWESGGKPVGWQIFIEVKNGSKNPVQILGANGNPSSLLVEVRDSKNKILPGSRPPSGAGASLDFGYSGEIHNLAPGETLELAVWQYNYSTQSAWLLGGVGGWHFHDLPNQKYEVRATYEMTPEHSALIAKNRNENLPALKAISSWIDVPAVNVKK